MRFSHYIEVGRFFIKPRLNKENYLMKNDLFPYLMLFSLILNMEIKLKEKGLLFCLMDKIINLLRLFIILALAIALLLG